MSDTEEKVKAGKAQCDEFDINTCARVSTEKGITRNKMSEERKSSSKCREDLFSSQQHVMNPLPAPPSTPTEPPSPFSNSCLSHCSLVYQGNEFIISLKLFVDLYRGGR